MTLLEVVISATILALAFSVVISSIETETRALGALTEFAATSEQRSQVLAKIERKLEFATGKTPTAFLTDDLSSLSVGSLALDTVGGFPAPSAVLLARGTENEEIVAYTEVHQDDLTLKTLVRGSSCSTPHAHPSGTEAIWVGLARPCSNQVNPSESEYDGKIRALEGTLFYQGRGTGFVYRVPIDPSGGNYYFTDGELTLGAEVSGTQTTDGWCCIYFKTKDQITELGPGLDINKDGDLADSFDLGQIRQRVWHGTDSEKTPTDVALGASIFLQETCETGSDLNADGFNDPIFVWDADKRRLHISLYSIAISESSIPAVHHSSLTLFMRNSAAL